MHQTQLASWEELGKTVGKCSALVPHKENEEKVRGGIAKRPQGKDRLGLSERSTSGYQTDHRAFVKVPQLTLTLAFCT